MRPPPRDFTDDERAQAVSHTAGAPGAPGVLVLHGFTGNPASMRAVADAFVATDHHVEMPRLPGHGTTLAELRTTAWGDWAGAADDAYRRLAGARRARRDHRAVDGWLAGAVDRARPPRRARPRARQPGDVRPARRGARDAPRDARGGHRGGAAPRQRHRPARQRGAQLRGHAAAPAAVVARRRPGADVVALRRADDAAAAVHVAPGSRGRPGRQRAPRRRIRRPGRPPLARRAAITSPRRTTTATTSSPPPSSSSPACAHDRVRFPARGATPSTSVRSRSTPTG